MVGEWKESTKLGDFVSLQRGTTYKSKLLDLQGPVLLGLASTRPNGGFRDDSLRTYGGDSPEKLILRPGDLYVSLKDVTQSGDLLGTVSRVPLTVKKGRLTQDTVKLIFKDNEISREYIFWLLRTPQYRAYCRARAMGTTNLSLSRDDFLSFPVLEPTAQQMSLISALENLESKIEHNRRTNATLEAMARALFKSWFVDFDPVRAKADGHAPAGMSAELAARFPDSFEDSPLGKVPRGWGVGTVGELGDIVCGKTPPTRDRENYGEDMPFITIPDMHGSIFVTDTAKRLSRKGVQTQPTKTLPAFSVCVSCIATPGLVALTSEPSQTNQQINSVIPKDKHAAFYCYYALRGLAAEIIARGSGGSVVTNLNKGQFSVLPMLIPPEPLTVAFQGTVLPLMEKLLSNEQQTRTLAALRDALLPKLLSGAVAVGDVEGVVS